AQRGEVTELLGDVRTFDERGHVSSALLLRPRLVRPRSAGVAGDGGGGWGVGIRRTARHVQHIQCLLNLINRLSGRLTCRNETPGPVARNVHVAAASGSAVRGRGGLPVRGGGRLPPVAVLHPERRRAVQVPGVPQQPDSRSQEGRITGG